MRTSVFDMQKSMTRIDNLEYGDAFLFNDVPHMYVKLNDSNTAMVNLATGETLDTCIDDDVKVLVLECLGFRCVAAAPYTTEPEKAPSKPKSKATRRQRAKQDTLEYMKGKWGILKGANWAAIDGDGTVYAYLKEPDISDSDDYWSPNGLLLRIGAVGQFGVGYVNWKLSLVERPAGCV